MPDLNTPLELGPVTLKNRLVMPPMVLFKESHAAWEPDAAHLEHYARRARAGVGLIVVEATAIAPEGRLAPFQLRAWEDEHLSGLARLARAIHEAGATALIQIHHAGANTRLENLDGALPVSPSGIPVKAESSLPLRALADADIEILVASFAAAALRCLKAGFDGVELHGAHGYLLSQFLSPAFNHRQDRWGGPTIRERLSFPLAVVRAVRAAVGAKAIVGYRLGVAEYFVDGLPLSEGLAAAQALAETDCLDLISVSNGMGGGQWPSPPPDFPFSQLIWLGAQVKQVVDLPVIAVGGIKTGQEARAALDCGVADLIAVGRAMLADPDWAAKALADKDKAIRLCRDCRRCAHLLPHRICAAMGEA